MQTESYTNMLSNELIRLIFEYSNLDDCVSLSQICSSYYAVWADLDTSLIRERVLERAPWFVALDEECGFDSWRKCALLVVGRSRKALELDDDGIVHKHLYAIRNLSLPVTLCCNKVEFVDSVDFSKDNRVRESMEPLFEELIPLPIDVYDGGAVQGTNLLLLGKELDLISMEVSKSDFQGTGSFRVRRSSPINVAIAPSGLRVVNERSEDKIRVMSENDSLLHVRFDCPLGVKDAIIHKASHLKKESGAYVVSSETSNSWLLTKSDGSYNDLWPLVSLLPNAGGALLVDCDGHYDGTKQQYLAYIEPLPSLPQVLLCELPPDRPATGHQRRHIHLSYPFFTVFNGYLYLYFEGRFLRLWVDLGLRSKLEAVDGLDNEPLRGQALTVWDRSFPALGTFAQGEDEVGGARILKQGRFVTVRDARGLVVGDLKTGTTHFNPKRVLSIPFAASNDGSSVGFYTVDNWVSKKVIKKMGTCGSDEESISEWWDEAVIPQVVRGGDPVFTRVVHPENVTDEPHSFADDDRYDYDWAADCDSDNGNEMSHLKMYCQRPPLVVDDTTIVDDLLYKHYEDYELPLDRYWVPRINETYDDNEMRWWLPR